MGHYTTDARPAARRTPAIVTIVGMSNAGKTTLIEKLVPELKRRGWRVGTVKSVGHGFQIDREGKDSWRHQQAGADAVAVIAPDRMALIRLHVHERLENVAQLMADMDLIIAEGFKSSDWPKVEVVRQAVRSAPLFGDDPQLLALVTDLPRDVYAANGRQVLGLEETAALANLLEAHFLTPRPLAEQPSNPPQPNPIRPHDNAPEPRKG
jgi:molybdopterin-guanine dinucleotide biosynthesis protein B